MRVDNLKARIERVRKLKSKMAQLNELDGLFDAITETIENLEKRIQGLEASMLPTDQVRQ